PVHEVESLLETHRDRLWIAGVNGPVSTVVAGDAAALQSVLAQCKAVGGHATVVKDMRVASHTPMVEPVLADFEERLRGIASRAPQIPMLSSVTGQVVEAGLDAAYWLQNLRQPMQFAAGVRQLLATGVHAFLEVSPHPILVGSILDGVAACESPPSAVAV